MRDGYELGEECLYLEDDHYIEHQVCHFYIYMDPDYASGLLSPLKLETFVQTTSPKS